MSNDFIGAGYANYNQLRDEELAKIVQRRERAARCAATSGTSSGPSTEEPQSVEQAKIDALKPDLVGVALSGGGIRSAVFNLGFLQALSQRGFLRYVDYLCSVSGGGYVAGHLAALANSVPETKCFHDIPVHEHDKAAQKPDPDERVAQLGVDARGKLTSSYRFRNIGSYLFSDIAGFVWRYILFTLLTVLLVVSLVGVCAAAAALLWRCLDLESVRSFLQFFGISDLGIQLGLGDETLIAFLPSLVPFVMLIVAAICRTVCHFARFRRGRSVCSGWCRFWLRCWGVSLLISTAVFLGNGETSFSLQQSLTQVQKNFMWPLLLLVLLSLLPLLKFSSVVDSTRPDAPAWKGIVAVVLMSFTCGAGPFFMVFWMARENVSGYALYRDSKLERNDVLDWPAFSHMSATLGATGSVPKADAAQVLAVQIDEDLHSPEILGQQTWDTHERLPYQSVRGAFARLDWLARYVAGFPSDGPILRRDPADANRVLAQSPNPIESHHQQLTQQRLLQQDAVDAFNARFDWPKPHSRNHSHELADPNLTTKLVQIACAVPAPVPPGHPPSPETALRWQEVSDGSPAKVLVALGNRSREPDNLKAFWHRALLDAMELPDAKVANPIRAAAVTEFLAPKLAAWNPTDLAKFNRLLLEALFPDVIRPRTMISTTIVPIPDQVCRLHWLVMWLCMSVVLLCIDWNFISPFFVFYRNKLSQSFVRSAGQVPADPDFEERDLRLTDLEPWLRGAPFPLMLASMHFFRNVSGTRSLRRDTDPPDADSCQPYLLTPLHCGSAHTGWMPTSQYCNGDIKLADAVALSGAAVTPFMVDNLGITALMAMANLRIGQWLPLPRHALAHQSQPMANGWRIGHEVLSALTSSQSPAEFMQTRRMALVADGGFHEFFGLEELLLRRCRLVVVVDAGCNNGRYEFGALADVLRMMRVMHGIEFLDLDHETPVEIGWLKRDAKTSQQPLHHCCFRARYPKHFPIPDGPAETLVVYAQMSLTGDEDLDLQQFRNVNPNFPDEPTTNQRYSSDQVESYRQLGFHIGSVVCRAVPESPTNTISAATWSDYFCEGFVQDWRRLVTGAAPLAETHSEWSRFLKKQTFADKNAAAEAAIRDYFSSRHRPWRENILAWLKTGRRPDAVPRKPEVKDVVQLVLACQSCTRPGGDLSELVFLPGGRSRLRRFASLYYYVAFERAGDLAAAPNAAAELPELEWSRHSFLKELRNIAFAPAGIPLAPDGTTPQPSIAVAECAELGYRIAAILLLWWMRDELPQRRLVCDDGPTVTEFEILDIEQGHDDPLFPPTFRPPRKRKAKTPAPSEAAAILLAGDGQNTPPLVSPN